VKLTTIGEGTSEISAWSSRGSFCLDDARRPRSGGRSAGDCGAQFRSSRTKIPPSGDLVRAIFSHTGRAYLIGVTGPPGAGKSTLVDRLVTTIRTQSTQSTQSQSFAARSAPPRRNSGCRHRAKVALRACQAEARGSETERRWFPTVGVIAVDPTSPFTGGAVLGDRLRMQSHAADEGVFIRSMATRGHLGGLARATGDAALVLDAAGKDVVVIETVGVGQDEVDIIRTADISIVTLVPAPATKCRRSRPASWKSPTSSSSTRPIAKAPTGSWRRSTPNLALHTYQSGEWRPPVVKTVATTGAGVAELVAQSSNSVRTRAGTQLTRARRAASIGCASSCRSASWITSSDMS
jgi:putative protein kinase ArgK-like GTPase of G3E family